jgi:glycosyltransferase involved in cell wall biosynthesis
VVRFAGKVIVHTTLQLEELCKQYPLYKNKYQYLQIGVGPALPPGDNLSLDLEEKFDFLLFGYICARKNIIQVIDNISKLNKIRGKNYSLCLAGKVRAEDKNFFEMTCKYILESGINCTIKTEILDEDIDSLFIKSKCVLFPYRIAVGASGPFCYALYHGNFIVAPFFGTFIDYQSSKLKHYKNDLEFTDVMSSICDKLDNKFIDDPGNDEVHQPTWTDYVIKTFT